MQLVPVLSTIILVGTIATFILAVFAYIMYKIREGRARDTPYQGAAAMHEPHVLMTPQQPMAAPQPMAVPQPTYMAPMTTMPPQRPYLEADQVRMPQPAPPRVAAPPAYHQAPRPAPAQTVGAPSSMFWEYTGNEGFVPVDTHRAQAAPRQQESMQDDGFAWL